jgi:tripartite-type tricarboxylate transporter receptor subunit TctC
LVLVVVTRGAAHADAVSDFYHGRTVNLICGYGPGGGYDLSARLLARHLGRHIPGSPTVVVQNMEGGGSLRAANFLYTVAPKDGATIGTFGRDMPLVAALGNMTGVRFDARKFLWLGSSSSFVNDAYLLMMRTDAPVKSVEEARRPGGPPLLLAGAGAGGSASDVPELLRHALGFNIKLVNGYDGNAIFLAVDRREVQGRTGELASIRALRPDWLKPGGGMHALVQFARVTRHPDFPDVPTARELATSETALALIELAEQPYLMARPFVAPPGIPADRAAALQAAFLAVHRDPAFLADAAQLSIELSPVGAEAVLRVIDKIASTPPGLLDQLRSALTDRYFSVAVGSSASWAGIVKRYHVCAIPRISSCHKTAGSGSRLCKNACP